MYIMKNCLKIISLILSIIMMLTAITSCGSQIDDENSSDTNESNIFSDSSNTDESNNGGEENYNPNVDLNKFPKNAFPIFDGSSYTVKVVISSNASSFERQVATSLRSALKKQTKKTISESSDYLKSGESHDANAYEILVGRTNYEESTNVYASTDYNNYGIKTIGNKIVFYFSTAAEGTELIESFISFLKNEEKVFWVETPLTLSNSSSSAVLADIPAYPTTYSSVDCADDTSMMVAKSTTLEKFNEYCAKLTGAGYTEYSKREDVDKNYFRTYTKGSTAVTAYFSTGRKQARIIVGPIKDIPSKDRDTTKETFTPSITMIGPSESVSGSLTIIYQLANGKFLIIDGGIILADRIYKELQELQPNATEFTIAGWFISHPHNDHQDGIEWFVERHGHEVNIENVYFNYANADYYNNPSDKDHTTEREGARVSQLRRILEKYLSHSTKIVKPHTGQIYTFGSAEVEIISTVEDILPTQLPHVNESSMVLRATVAGQTTMLLGDASSTMKGIIRDMYDSHVKSDMLTLAHHGVWDTTPELYNEIKAKVVFWPNNTEGAKMYYNKSSTSEARKSIVAALNNATDVFLAKGTDTKLDLPYTPVGNKDSFINSTLK